MNIEIREETAGDHAGIREVNRLAFEGEEEALLVDRLRAQGLVVASLVAVAEDRVVGHILFSRLPIETPEGAVEAVALAPMAVRPEMQRSGIGSGLVRRGLEVARRRGEAIVIVVGHPGYYPRLGFSAQLAGRLSGPFSGDVFMALELIPGALDGVTGIVRYPEAFGLDEQPAPDRKPA
ncbi:MAG: N-acetyltransferase [Bryobacterales bacterium]|nr:N-acetyltransferase [Bryobacterales bacterium]